MKVIKHFLIFVMLWTVGLFDFFVIKIANHLQKNPQDEQGEK